MNYILEYVIGNFNLIMNKARNISINKKSFTIIIPYFNSSKYIEKNIESIAFQNYDKNFIQILLIDDGSTEENTKEHINYLSKKHNITIEYYKKENGNWGSVINYAIKNNLIKNDYVMVLDSDDALKQNCFYYVNKKCKNVDIYAISFRKWDGNKNEYTKVYPYWQLRSNVTKNKSKTPFCGPLSFFYKKELFLKIKPLEEKVFYQDSILLAQIVNMANKIRFTKKQFSKYYFRRVDSSTSMEWNQTRFKQECLACDELIKLGWGEIVAYRLAVREFRNACLKYNKKFEINYKIKFNFFPWFIRFLYNLFFQLKIKKFFSFS